MIMRAFTTVAILLILAGSLLADSILLRSGELRARVSYFAASANDLFGSDGSVAPLIPGLHDFPYAERSFAAFAEYGLTEDLTVFASLPFRRVFVHDSSYQHISTGLADVSLGASYHLIDYLGFVGSGTLALNIPTPYPRDYAPPLGAGQVDIALAANITRTFEPISLDARATLGFTLRTGIFTSTVSSNPLLNADFQDHAAYANELFWNLEAGWRPVETLRLHAVLLGLGSLTSGGTTFTLNRVPTTHSWLKLGTGAEFTILSHYDVLADVLTTLSGNNTPKTIEIVLGAGVRF